MAFKMKGFKPFTKLSKKIKTARAKRLIRKHVGSTTSDAPNADSVTEKEFNKADEKMIKAARLLEEAGYDKDFARETATGSEGYEVAMDFAKKKKNKKKK